MKVLWIARYKDQYVYGGGHEMIGFCGWHETPDSAIAEAFRRFPDVPVDNVYVSRA